jgi:hypothetical protein
VIERIVHAGQLVAGASSTLTNYRLVTPCDFESMRKDYYGIPGVLVTDWSLVLVTVIHPKTWELALTRKIAGQRRNGANEM